VVLPDNNANLKSGNAGSDLEATQHSYILICERDQVEQVLQHILQTQTNLAIQINTSEGIRTAQSTALRIEHQPKPPHVILHQPGQSSWSRFLQERPTARINCNMPNGRLNFLTRLAPLEAVLEGGFYFCFAFPDEIRKYQRRASFRVSVMPGTSMVMLLIADNRIGGECLDFSIGGCRLILQPGFHNLHENTELDNLVLNLAGLADITVNVKICRIATTKSGRLIVGAQYLDLTVQQQNQLQAALTRIQREQLKNNTRLT
jgi:c-di-GMP-binding flagellar brake protein YcgR